MLPPLAGPPIPPATPATAAPAPAPAPPRPIPPRLACRAGGRIGDARWVLNPHGTDPPLHVLSIKWRQQYETPASMVAIIREKWAPDFDAMATPFSTICAAYATADDDILQLRLCPQRPGDSFTIFGNPAPYRTPSRILLSK